MSADNTARIAILLDGSQARSEAKATSAELNGIGAAAKAAGVSATVGLSQVEAATQQVAAGTSSLGVRQLELQNDLKRVKAEIAGYAANLQELNSLTPRTAAAQAQLNLEIKQETVVLEESIAIQAQYKAELSQVNAALAGNTVETTVNTAAQVEAAGAAGLTTRQVVQLGVAVNRMTGVVIPGGRAIGTLAGSFSAAILPQLALIVGISLLIGWLVKLGRAKEDTLKIDDEALAKDALLATMARTVAEAYEREQIVLKDMRGLLIGYKEGIEALTAAKLTEANATRAAVEFNQQLAHSAELTKSTGDAMAGSLFEVGKSVESVMHAEGEATVKRQEAQSVLDKNIAALIRFAAETGKSKGEVMAMAQAIPELSGVLGRLEDDLNNGALAVAKFNLQLNKLSVPSFDISKTVGGIQAQAKAVKEGLGDIALGTQAAAQLGIRNYDDQIRALSPTLKGLAADLKQNKNALGEGNEEVARAIQRYDQLEVKHKSGAGAARAHALAENALTRELKDAQAALIGDSFAARDQKITNDVAAEREALRIKKELNSVAIGQLVELEKAKHQKVAQDRIVAENRLMDELQQMQIAGMESETQREQATLALRLKQRTEEIHKEFGYTVEAEELVNAFRKASAQELHRWLDDKEKTRRTEWIHAESQMWQTIDAERLAKDKETLQRGLKVFKEEEQAGAALGRGIGLTGTGTPAQAAILQQITERMKQMHVTMGNVRDDLGKDAAAARLFNAQLDRMAAIAKGDSLGVLRANLAEVFQDFQFVNSMAQEFGNSLASAFEQIIAGGFNFVQFITKMVASVLSQLGSILIARGVADILQGIAINANPFTFGLGFPLIAAGNAELAQGLVFEALGGIAAGIGALAGQKSTGAAAGTSAASSGASAAPEAPRQGVPPRITPFPTSGPTSVTLRLDRNLSNDLIKGNDVVVMADFHGTGSNTPALRKRISKWSKSPYAS